MLVPTVLLLAVAQTAGTPQTPSRPPSEAVGARITPGDLLQRLDDFRASLSIRDRRALDRELPRDAEGGIAKCDTTEGSRASCENSAYMSALRRLGLMPRFQATLQPARGP